MSLPLPRPVRLSQLLWVVGCAGQPPPGPVAAPPRSSPALARTQPALARTQEVSPKGHDARADEEWLTLAEARLYMVSLINRDRKSMGLPPVVLDNAAATRAGQRHAEDMAMHGFLGHWGTDGSVPEQRHTEEGGADMVLENASCFTDEKERTLDEDLARGEKRIRRVHIDKAEDMFFHEEPPHDGHRKNILKPLHTRVGIGIAQPRATEREIPVPCVAQEFVDGHGSYGALPRTAKVGTFVDVSGDVAGPSTLAGVGLSRVDLPKPLSPKEANRRRSYPVPPPFQMYWPPGYKTPIPVTVQGGRFSISVPLSDARAPGLYGVSIWARHPASPDLVMVGLRTVLVR